MRKIAIAAGAVAIIGLIGFVAAVFAAATLTVSPNRLLFDGVALGTTSAPQTVTVTNRSGGAIYIGGFTASSGFHVIDDKCTGIDLAAGASCTIGVTFTALKNETVDGELAVKTSPPVPLSMNGEGAVSSSSLSVPLSIHGEGLGEGSNNRRSRHRRGQSVELTGIAGPPASGIFVANPYADSVTVYDIAAADDAAPTATLLGSATLLDYPFGIAAGPGGTMYVANYSANSVTVYAAGSSGNASPTTEIGGALTGLASPEGIAVDSSGNIYVANDAPGFGSITVFGAGQSGDVAPVQTIAGGSTGLAYPSGVAVDSSGNIYAANLEGGTGGGGSITVFANSANGNAAPFATITAPATGLGQPSGIAVDLLGQIYVANNSCGPSASGCITIYAPLGSQTGNLDPAPIKTIGGPDAELNDLAGIAVDGAGTMYVTSFAEPGEIAIYYAWANGDMAPAATIAGGDTGLMAPRGVAELGIRPTPTVTVTATPTATATVTCGTILQVTGGTLNFIGFPFGQGFTTPSGGPWNAITFNFFSDSGSTPAAVGTAYIFTSPYGGTILGLSASSYLAASTGISGGAYVFNPAFNLSPSTTYYLYEDTVPPSGFDGQLVSGTFYVGAGPGFFSGTGTLNFRVSGCGP